jgi:hypothetical protein
LEQLDGITRGILQDDLPATHAGDDFIAEMSSSLIQPFDNSCQVIYPDVKTIPAAWFLGCAIWHGLPASTGRVRLAKHKA